MMGEASAGAVYEVRHYQRDISVTELVKRFRDAERFAPFCRACHNYGRSWACPPFSFDETAYLTQWSQAVIVATKISPFETCSETDAGKLLREVRVGVDSQLLQMERATGGRAFSYAGSCSLCGSVGCSRMGSRQCRHPELVRPSLEAFGFDISAMLTDLFGIRLLWPKQGVMPPYLMLVTALLNNGGQSSETKFEL